VRQTLPPRQDAYLLDYARALFMTSVAVVHLEAIIAQRLDEDVWLLFEVFRGTGYQFFFVLTGFLGYLAAMRLRAREAPVQQFALRRFARLVPLLWLIVLGNAAAEAILSGRLPDMASLTASLVPLPSAVEPNPVIVWTLRHVLMFYLLLALWLWKPRTGLLVGGVWLAGCLAAALLATRGIALPIELASLFNSFNLQFFLGTLAAWGVASASRPASSRALWGVLGLAAAIVALGHHVGNGREHLLDYASPNAVFWPIAYGAVFALMIAVLARYTPRRRPFAPILAIAGASYAIYLSHAPVMGMIAMVAEASGLALPATGFALATLGAAIGVGMLLHRWFELPVASLLEARADLRRQPVRAGG
jgi:exopolysaccharide production protein ExoZ